MVAGVRRRAHAAVEDAGRGRLREIQYSFVQKPEFVGHREETQLAYQRLRPRGVFVDDVDFRGDHFSDAFHSDQPCGRASVGTLSESGNQMLQIQMQIFKYQLNVE